MRTPTLALLSVFILATSMQPVKQPKRAICGPNSCFPTISMRVKSTQQWEVVTPKPPAPEPSIAALKEHDPCGIPHQDEQGNYWHKGRATWYGRADGFHGRPTASGEIFDADAFTAASRTLPFGTVVEVEGPIGTATVRINDRGPWVKTDVRCLDLSSAAFRQTVGPISVGVADVRYRIVG